MPISDADLPQLLSRIEARDERAYKQLYRHYSPMVQSFLRTKVRDEALLQDVVSRTLFEVWQFPTRYQPDRGAKFSTWLIQIASHKLTDARRGTPPATEELTEDLSDAYATQHDGYAETLKGERNRIVHYCIERLRPRLREFAQLVFLAEMSELEVANQLGCARGTVKSSMSLARAALRPCIEKRAGPGGVNV